MVGQRGSGGLEAKDPALNPPSSSGEARPMPMPRWREVDVDGASWRPGARVVPATGGDGGKTRGGGPRHPERPGGGDPHR